MAYIKINIVPATGDTSTPANGDIWYNDTTGKFRAREAGTTKDLISTGSGGGSDQVFRNLFFR